jgi:transcriptional regulator with XRE-family HTH domain
MSNSLREQDHPTDLSELIRDAIDREGLTQKAVAQAAGVHPSHLSQVLSGGKGFSKEKLVAVADVLDIPQKKILKVAQRTTGPEEQSVDIDPRSFLLLPRKRELELKIVTDPRFFDSALFLWSLNRRPFESVGIRCEPALFDWSLVPQKVERLDKAVGFFNRRSAAHSSRKRGWNIDVWCDLSLYKGYAVLARDSDIGDTSIDSHLDVNNYINEIVDEYKDRKTKPEIICIGQDTIWKVENPINPDINRDNFNFWEIADPDQALEKFIEGEGELFIGGLPQRLNALEYQDCSDVITYANNPLMFSTNSLVYSKGLSELRDHRPILNIISSLWFSTISKLRSDESFRGKAINEIPGMVENFGYTDHSIDESILDKVLPGSEINHEYEFFAAKPKDITDHMMDNNFRIMDFIEKKKFDDVDGIFAHMSKTLSLDID